MNYKLVKSEVSSIQNKIIDLAVSDSRDKLIKWAKKEYGVEPVKPRRVDKEEWTGYIPKEKYFIGKSVHSGWLEIHESNLKIL